VKKRRQTGSFGRVFLLNSASRKPGGSARNCTGCEASGTMNQDFVDLLRAFTEAEVRFLVVGAYALALHSKPRATGDLDLWVEPTIENGARVMRALGKFGAPLQGVMDVDFATSGNVFQIGVAPRRIDILTVLTGLTFQEAWVDRNPPKIGPCDVFFLGKRSLIRNKELRGRPKDLADLESLGESKGD
jgi:hypothetical protein